MIVRIYNIILEKLNFLALNYESFFFEEFTYVLHIT